MNENLKIFIGILVLVILYLLLNNTLVKEKFTSQEMKKYPQMLDTNCTTSTDVYNKLLNRNKERCNLTGKTQRDTINNKRLCYDDIAKEIVSKLDAESNCVMSDLIKKRVVNQQSTDPTGISTGKLTQVPPKPDPAKLTSIQSVLINPVPSTTSTPSTTSVPSTQSVPSVPSTTSTQSVPSTTSTHQSSNQNLKIDEGPDFINNFFIPSYDTKKSGNYSSINLETPVGTNNKYSATAPYDDVGVSLDSSLLYKLSHYSNPKKINGLEKR
jgi:hypothetical protein